MKKILFILLILLIPISFAYRDALTAPYFDRYSSERDSICFIDDFPILNIMYINLENHLNDTVYYRLNNNSDGIIISNYTIKVRAGREWYYVGDLI